MSLTKPLNSKVNMKQYSDADLPLNPKQPAVARYAAESTLNQTVINLPFQVDTVNAADSFILSVDGKVLTPGSLNDYQFTAVDSFGFSNTITLNYALAAGLNIQGIKLGLKKETEFLQDARFTALYEGIDQGLQGFVRTSDLMVATSTTGAPGSGLFYSTIVNRASMPDLRSDLKARMGIERLPLQQLYQISNEFGPNGEPVYGVLNDSLGQIRFVGTWNNNLDAYGVYVSSASTGAYLEVTFYGTGLNLFYGADGNSRDWRVSVDGGSEGASILSSSSGAIGNRNYNPRTQVQVISGLSLGVHTVKIRYNSGTSIAISDLEIVNEVTSLKIQPGASYIAGKKITTLAQQSLAYNSSFESGTLGTRGGRVVVYQKSDGTITKAVQPTDTASATLSSANHQNEEIARTYHWREFGSGRADDFSGNFSSGSNLAFSLDDGSTTLIGSAVSYLNDVLYLNGNGSYIILTFVGTGLDFIRKDIGSGSVDTFTYAIDGSASAFSFTFNGNKQQQKVVSGLPYGTHTVKITRTSATSASIGFQQFVVYQPKKPTVPSGAVELADYNVMADYTQTSSVTTVDTIGNGMLRKVATREFVYVDGTGGTQNWNAGLQVVNSSVGFEVSSDRSGAYFEYVFFGTGFEQRSDSGSGFATSVQISLQNLSIGGSLQNATITNFPTMVNGTGSSSTTFTNSTGILNKAANATIVRDDLFRLSNLPLALWKVRFTNNNASTFLQNDNFNIITPIHSHKSNLYSDIQNTLTVGSCSISDNRNTSALKAQAVKPQSVVKAYGTTSASLSISSYIPIPDMSATVMCANDGDEFEIQFEGNFSSNTAGTRTFFQIMVDGNILSPVAGLAHPSTINYNVHLSTFVTLSKGAHKIDVIWATDGSGTRSRNTTESALFVKKVN